MRSRIDQPMRSTSARRLVCGLGCLLVVALLSTAPFAFVAGRASAATGAANRHSLTVVVGFPDPGLANTERMCLTLFAGSDASLARPLQTQCLTPDVLGVTFHGLASASYRIVVPGTGSAIQDGRYEGQIVSTEIPTGPAVSDYVVQVQLGLASPRPPVTGTHLVIKAIVCPVATDGGSSRPAWAAACAGQGNGITFGLTDGRGNPVASVVTGQGGAAPGSAVVDDLAPGHYQLSERVPDNIEPVPVWFAEVQPSGRAMPLGPDGLLDLGQGQRVTVWVYNVLRGIGSAPVAVPASPGPGFAPTAPPAPAATPPAVLARRLPAAGAGYVSGGWSAVALGLLVLIAAASALAARFRGRPVR